MVRWHGEVCIFVVCVVMYLFTFLQGSIYMSYIYFQSIIHIVTTLIFQHTHDIFLKSTMYVCFSLGDIVSFSIVLCLQILTHMYIYTIQKTSMLGGGSNWMISYIYIHFAAWWVWWGFILISSIFIVIYL